MYNKIIEKLENKKICILGFGKEGKSTYNFIRRHSNMHITIIDKCDIRDSISDNNVDFVIGDNYLDNLNIYDLIIKTPGITLKDIDYSSYENKITSQMELVLEVFKDKAIGITGTKGKSTTTSLIYNILKDQNKKVYIMGNIGIPMLDEVESYDEDTYLVIEMSAHQLEFTNISPHISIILNLFEDHLDHAGSVYHYHMNKMNIFKYQNYNDYGIYSSDDLKIQEYIDKFKYKNKLFKVTQKNINEKNTIYLNDDYVMYESQNIYNINSDRKIVGNHNLYNIMCAYAVGIILSLNLEKIGDSIKQFTPLEHRMELVDTIDDITYYNDSIATIPNATINAIEALKDVDTLIFGGMDRGINYEPLIEYLKDSSIKNLICMPTTGYKIGKYLETLSLDKNYYYTNSLEEAVKISSKVTKKGKIVLMSPAASSYEYFKNFEEKGKKYKEYISNLREQ